MIRKTILLNSIQRKILQSCNLQQDNYEYRDTLYSYEYSTYYFQRILYEFNIIPKSGRLHEYIIGHFNPLILCALVLYAEFYGRTYSLTSTPNNRFL